MKNIVLVFAIIFCSNYSIAQNFKMEFDHTVFMVKDMKVSAEFYEDIMHLKELETSWGFIDWGRFYEIGENQQLHLALLGSEEIKPKKMLHLAFAVNDFDAYLDFLTDNGIVYSNFPGEKGKFQIRPDNVKQIYFQDPDGYWIEVNNADHQLNK